MVDEGTKLGALSSLMASYGDDSAEEEDEAVTAKQDEVEVSPRQLASEILDGLVATACRGESRRPDAFTAAQEQSGSEEEGSDSDDSGNEVRTVQKSERRTLMSNES